MWVRFPPGTYYHAPLEWVNLVVVRHLGSIDSLAPARSPFGLRLFVSAPAGRIPAGDIVPRSFAVGELRVVSHLGSIDSLSPESSPCGLRPCRTAPAGSIPAWDITLIGSNGYALTPSENRSTENGIENKSADFRRCFLLSVSVMKQEFLQSVHRIFCACSSD